MKYSTFFRVATGGRKPYPYQEQFATADELPHLLRAPTGAGKTAAAVLGWLFRRHAYPVSTPRRLIYCLPVRVLVEQSFREAGEWVANLKKHLDAPLVDKTLAVHLLMGGVEAEDDPWYLHPERPTILIGTQDMLLSRALNRGYAESRFHWPIDFGLLNNDCLWVFDEPQLMAGGVATSAQLSGLRKKLGTFNGCPSVWMSATLEPTWLDTFDFAGEFPAQPLELDKADYDPELPLKKRMTAKKTLSATDVVSSKDMKEAAKKIWASHEGGTQTLAVINTVERAKTVYSELEKLRKKADSPSLLLVHSRFRPYERVQLNETLQKREPGDRIIVATQVVEAGVDISARTLVTELAPWPSLVQRMGRCNRTGDDGSGQVLWLNLDEKSCAPYDEQDLQDAREFLDKLEGEDVSPKALDKFKDKEGFTLRFEHRHVMRRRDLLDLFDTAPDLSGNDIDVARFVRGDDPDTDAQVFWRVVPGEAPSPNEPQPSREELCSVPIKSLRAFLESAAKKRCYGFIWNHLDRCWDKLDSKLVRPGIVVLLPCDAGGYDWDDGTQTGRGWDPTTTKPVKSRKRPDNDSPPPDVASDENTQNGAKLTIAAHTENVCRELATILGDKKSGLRLPNDWSTMLTRAARWHDVGKAHDVFRFAMERFNGPAGDGQHWAKSGGRGRLDYQRKYFRHELASALAALQHDLPFAAAYLVAAHHGRPRLAIRALPDETEPPTPDTLFALGVRQGDTFGPVDLGGEICPAVVIDLSPMQLGGDASWTARALKLLEELGPFKLAYLEALLRAADMRASRKEAKSDA